MRKSELDICRIIACLMVIMVHVVASGWYIDPNTFEWTIFNFTDTIVRGGVPLFFMISGALFLNQENFNIKHLWVKNIVRLICIYFIWSSLYALNNFRFGASYANLSVFINTIIDGYYHLWFLPAMIMVYLFLPVVYYSIYGGKQLKITYLLILFGVTTMLTTNLYLIPNIPDTLKSLMDKIDLLNIRYLGYMIWGYWLSSQKVSKKATIAAITIFIVCTIIAAYGNWWYSTNAGVATEWLYGYFSIPTFIQASSVFCMCQCFKGIEFKSGYLLKSISDCTLGVYLLHPMIIEMLSRNGIRVSAFNPVLSVPLVFVLVILISFLIIGLLKRVPLVRKCI